jgi:hypothetical protein
MRFTAHPETLDSFAARTRNEVSAMRDTVARLRSELAGLDGDNVGPFKLSMDGKFAALENLLRRDFLETDTFSTTTNQAANVLRTAHADATRLFSR